MAAIDDLRTAVADLQSAAQSEHDELDAVVTALGTVEGQLTQLQTQVSQGGGVSAGDLESVTQSVAGIAAAARSAVESAKGSPAVAGAGGGGAAPAPTGGAPAPDPGAPAPTGGAPAPGPAGGGGAPAASVYVFGGDTSTVDTTVWPAADVETAEPTPQPLFHYSGDTAPGDTNGDGVGGIWHLYTGPTQPAGTGAAGGAGGEA